MDAFKLMMDHCYFDERIPIAQIIVIDEMFQISHQSDNFIGMLRWDVNGCVSEIVFQRGARQFAETRAVFFDGRLNMQDIVIDQ